jgi:hypothetical protein
MATIGRSVVAKRNSRVKPSRHEAIAFHRFGLTQFANRFPTELSGSAADRLNTQAISVDHGAPLRLIAHAHYGYKSIKHLSRIEFRDPAAGYQTSGLASMDLPRARVAHEERGWVLPGSLLRYLYRLLIPGTAIRFARASASRNAKSAQSGDTEA